MSLVMIFYYSTCDLSYYNHCLIIATCPLGKPTSNVLIAERSPRKYAIITKFYDTCGNEFIFLYLAPHSICSLKNKPQNCKNMNEIYPICMQPSICFKNFRNKTSRHTFPNYRCMFITTAASMALGLMVSIVHLQG